MFYGRLLARGHGRQGLVFATIFIVFTVFIRDFAGRFFAINGQPTRLDQDLAFGFELVLGGHGADARGHGVLRCGIEHRHKAARDQIVDFLLSLRQTRGWLRRGDDGKVVTHLSVIKHAFAGAHHALIQRGLGMRR